jgi:hypothetical protein
MLSMRDFLKRSGRWLRAGWFWPLVLLALPTCALSPEGIANPNPADPGDDLPLTSAVMCDIPQVPDGGVFLCANPMDLGIGMARDHGAVALNLGETNSVVLDYSPDAQNQCGAGNPLRIDFFNAFPNGTTFCLNCGQQIPSKYADPADACVAKCKELVSVSGPQPPGGVDEFCKTNARVSTNFDKTKCFDNICTSGGNPLGVTDSRVNPEDLTWLDFSNTSAAGNTLSFGGPVNGNFNGGAASDELITTGDAWVEFEAGEPGVSHVLGLRTSCDKIANCPDNDGTVADIGFAISLNSDNQVYVLEDGGNTIIGPIGNPYTPGERFRIHVVDHHDGTADISYSRHPALCSPGSACSETPITSHVGVGPSYPLRVDATFREAPASVKNVTIMRIKN